MKLNIVQYFLSRQFRSLGRTIAKHPGYFIVVPILICGILATGLQRSNLYKDLDGLYTADGSEAMNNRELLEKLFPTDTTENFDFERMTRLGRVGFLFFVPKDGSSVLTEKMFAKVKKLDSIVHNITVKSDGFTYRYSDVCAKKKRKCFKNEYLSLEKRMLRIENKTDFIQYPLYLNTRNFDYAIYGTNLGAVTTDHDGNAVEAKAVRLAYFLDSSNSHKEKLALMWEREFASVISNLKMEENIDVYCYTSSSVVDEIHRITLKLVPLYAVAVLIMLCFSISTTMSTDWVKSKPWCSVVGSLCSGLAVVTSFGLLAYCGVDYIDINIAIPFLMLGIGMDDTFVLLAAWRCTPQEMSVEERLGKAYKEAAVSITVTSLTNFISFLIGLTTPFPVVRLFCLSAASAVFFTYILQITLFGGFMALFGYAEKRRLHSLTFLPIKDLSDTEKKNFFFRILCATGQKDSGSTDKEEFFMMAYFRDSLGKTLSNIYVKYVVIVVFLVYLTIGIWSCTQIKEGLEFQRLVPYDSYSLKAFDTSNEMFNEYRDRVQVVINTPLEYSDPKVQDQLEELVQKFEASRYISSSKKLTEFWLRYFKTFISDKRTSILFENYNISDKADFLQCLRRVFLKFSGGKIVRDDIIFDENQTTIVASRFILQTVNVSGVVDDNKMLLDLRRIAKEAPFPVFVHHPLFVFYDQFQMVSQASFQSVGIAAIIMMIVTFIFIPSITTVLSVAASIISIEIGVIGYMTLWNVNLDTVSMINLIMCIGFSVDFAAHISHAYKHSSGKSSPNERMCNALYMVGLPIVQGSLSTVLAILVLMSAPAYIFLVFFKIIVLVIVFAALHALFLLPVLFSLFGSINCSKATESINSSDEDIPKTTKRPSLRRKLSSSSAPTSYLSLDERRKKHANEEDRTIKLTPESGRPAFYRSTSLVNPCYVNDESDFCKSAI